MAVYIGVKFRDTVDIRRSHAVASCKKDCRIE